MKSVLGSLVAISCLLVSGCNRTPSIGSSARSIVPSSDLIGWTGNETALPGIEQATVYHYGTDFVVWSDADGGHFEVSTRIHGRLATFDGHEAECLCEIKEGKTRQVTINGDNYDLADGNLALVSLKGEQSPVKQLKRDIRELNVEPKSLEAFGRRDPEITEFFTRGAKAR